MSINVPQQYFNQLPASEIANLVNSTLQQNSTLIITAPPGAGKSTLLPLTMLNAVAENQKILMLEPRRLAARQIAERMSEMIGCEVGAEVGYRVRFDNKVSANTRIEVLTEGILTRMLQSDNTLDRVGMVVFDEFHERSLFADVALALCRECQQILRPDLKIVIMSATIDTTHLAQMLGGAPVIESKGKMFPVDIRHSNECDAQTAAAVVAHVIREAHKTETGDILAFLPGEAEINQCRELLGSSLGQTLVMPLYGMLPQAKQRAAILPDKQGRRKVVLSTPIAETSLTIEGVRVVVDSGLCRQLRFDPNSGLSRLETVRISLDMANQRAGRAGRLCHGVCYRLWSTATEHKMAANREPEILNADLSQLVLDLAAWGETDANRLVWLCPPPRGHVFQAKELLEMLGAINEENGTITDFGRRINQLPTHPRIAKMLLTAANSDEQALATDIAALLDERDPLPRETGIDITLRIDALRRNRADNRHNKPLDRIEKIAAQYRSLLKIEPDNSAADTYRAGFLIAAAYPERIASAHAGNNAQFMLSGGNLAQTSHTDSLADEPWLAIAHMDARDGKGKIFLAAPLDPTDLRQMIVERDNVSWDSKRGQVIMQHEMRIGRLVLAAKPIQNVSREKIDDVILRAIERDGENILNWTDDVIQLQNRIQSLRMWAPELNLPNVSACELCKTARKWLQPYLGKALTESDLERINLADAIKYMLTFEQQQQIDSMVPSHIAVPSGSRIKLEYQPNGSTPILAVRLQECFGLTETPTVCNGKQKVLMHLLSPGFKPVQVTQDLASFWQNAYFEVRKELRTRYPKHVWPDDPFAEKATRGIKKPKS
ncbi:MAG: ATP-dependent helicase HrpB [Salinivirgaceae bacterium]|nr:ATP-dependent helicase HrpB [Salinivirgaceae bacterium]